MFQPVRKRKLSAPPIEARVARKLFPGVRPLEREPAKDRLLDELSLKRGRNSEEDSEARTSKKKGRGESMEIEEATTSAASAPMESDESIADELSNALDEEVASAKVDEESDLELDFDDTWSTQAMWSSRSDVYSPTQGDADDEASREECLAALEKSTKQVLDEVCDKLNSWRPYNSSTDTSPRSTPRDVVSRASEREPLIIEEDELLPDLNLVEGSSPNSGTLAKR